MFSVKIISSIWITIVAAIILASCEKLTEPKPVEELAEVQPLPALSIPWTAEQSVVCFGTSLTYGYQPGRVAPDSSYPFFLGQRLKIRVVNQGYPGARIHQALQLVGDSVLAKQPALVLLEFGANDFIQGIPADTAEVRLSLLVEKILASGSAVILISFTNPDIIKQVSYNSPFRLFKESALAYYAMLNRVAEKYSLEIVTRSMQGIYGYAGYTSDLLHPNGRGYQRMEENIHRALTLTFGKNGMYR